jgi:hypothetical protein
MPTTNYYTINGRIRSESTGGTRTGYLPDALGSVTATTNSTGSTLVNTYRYKPYGAQLAKTGAGGDPAFQWIGLWGYRTDDSNRLYVRQRHLSSVTAGWQSQDPLLVKARRLATLKVALLNGSYAYVSNPVTRLDYTGLSPTTVSGGGAIFSGCTDGLCVGIGTDNCISIPDIPLMSIGVATLMLSLSFCVTKYDSACCPAGDWAAQCHGIEVSASLCLLGIKLDIEKLDQLLDTISGNLGYDILRNLIQGTGDLIAGSFSKKECVPTGTRCDLSLCASACVVIAEFELCKGLIGADDSAEVTLGFCGTPNVCISLKGRCNDCI